MYAEDEPQFYTAGTVSFIKEKVKTTFSLRSVTIIKKIHKKSS